MKLNSVQYLRGLAAVTVVVAHGIGYPAGIESPYLTLMGRFGVILFFVISGFIITVTTGPGAFDPYRFARKRFVRVVPFYWLMTLVTAALALAAPQAFRHTAFGAAHLAKSLLFVPYFTTENGVLLTLPILKLGWTLNYELFFYAGFACLCAVGAAMRFATLLAVFALLFGLGAAFPVQNAIWRFFTDYFILFFLIGMGLGLLQLGGRIGASRPAIDRAMAAGAVVLLAGIVAITAVAPDGLRDALTALFAALLTLIALRAEAGGRFARSAVLERLGDASYSVYLVHMFGVGGASVIGRKLAPLLGSGTYPVSVALCIVAGVVIGLLAYRLVERPMTAQLGLRRPETARG